MKKLFLVIIMFYIFVALWLISFYYFCLLPFLNKRRVKTLLKKYSKPSTFNRKGKAISFKSTDFYISIDGKDVKGSISRFSMEIGSLSTSLIGMGISTTYGETLKDIDIKILENAGTLIDSTLKGKSFEYSSWPSPVATQKLINYIFERIEEEGFKPVLKKKK